MITWRKGHLMKILLKFEGNYADEFDLEGFCVIKQEEWEKFAEYYHSRTEEITCHFGSNQEMWWRNGTNMLLDFKATVLPAEDLVVLIKYFGKYRSASIGYTPFWSLYERMMDEIYEPTQYVR